MFFNYISCTKKRLRVSLSKIKYGQKSLAYSLGVFLQPCMDIEKELYIAAVELAEKRYPKGWGGAAAVRVESGKVLTSVAPDIKNESLGLCMEVGAYLEAHKIDEVVTHSLSVSRETEKSEFVILTPCGVCQERLVHWGGNVLAAITNPENKVIFKNIRELQPHHWSAVNGEQL